MAMGAVYIGQLAHSVIRCLKRLRVPEDRIGQRRGDREASSDEEIVVVSPVNQAPVQGRGSATKSSSTSRSIRRRSGFAARAVSQARALAADAASSASSAAAAAERASDLAAVVMASSQAAAESFSSGKGLGKGAEIQNPWNLFQHENRNKGWTPQKMASEDQRQRAQKCLQPGS